MWVLFDFEDDTSEWRRFADEQALQDFVRKDTGEPMLLPPPSLSPIESARLVEESRAAVAQVTEEFKRFRVKAEIIKKQKDAEARQVKANSISEQQRRISGHDAEGERHRARLQEEQLSSLREELEDKEDQWRKALEALKHENEQLKSEGGEAIIAAQWRERFEQATAEKAELAQKLRLLQHSAQASLGSSALASGADSSASSDGEMLRRFNELREEYKLYRKRAMEAIQEKESLLQQRPGALAMSSSGGADDPKLQYLRNLMLKYLCTDEFEAKEHMERAITTILQFSDAERAFVDERRSDASATWLSSWGDSWLSASAGVSAT